MKNEKLKRIVALAGVVILVSLYVLTLVAALLAKPYAHGMFLASIYSSLVIPVLIYGFILVTKAFGRKDGEMSMNDYRKMKREIKKIQEDNDCKENEKK